MPFIRSLPFEEPLDVADLVEGITRDFAQDTGIALENVIATWTFLEPGHYAVGGHAVSHQPRSSHPVLVDLLASDRHSPAAFEGMLASAAASVSARAGVPIENVFINHRAAQSGTVFDAGQIVRW